MAIDTVNNSSGTYSQQLLAGQIQKTASQIVTDAQQINTASNQPDDKVQVNYPAATKNLDTVRAIELMHARLNELAKGVRQTNEGLAQAAEITAQMKNQLQAITKNFPPFSVDSSQRQQFLMSYVSLKKEIEQLMVPPPPKPLYEGVKHMWDSMFAENGQMLASAVPKLERTSSDPQVKDAVDALDKNNQKLATISDGITNALIKGQ